MELHWLSAPEWNALIEDAGLVVEALYGWFDRRPVGRRRGQIWVCTASALTRRCAQNTSDRVADPHDAGLEHLGVDPEARLAADRRPASRRARGGRRGRGRPCPGSPRERRSAASPRRRAASPRRPARGGRASAPRSSASRPVELEQHPEAPPVAVDQRRATPARRASPGASRSPRRRPPARRASSERPTRSESASANGPFDHVTAHLAAVHLDDGALATAPPRSRRARRRAASSTSTRARRIPRCRRRARAPCRACRCRGGARRRRAGTGDRRRRRPRRAERESGCRSRRLLTGVTLIRETRARTSSRRSLMRPLDATASESRRIGAQ